MENRPVRLTSMSTDQHEQSNGEPHAYHDELVAYLDGELDAASTHRIENLLASNPAIRNELHRLERTWDLLDELPRVTVDESFASSTAEMVAIAAERELEAQKAELPRQRRRWWTWSVAVLAAAVLCGFLGMRWLLPDPNRQLLADLPILENLDAYRQAGSVEFLRMLSTERPIPVPGGDSAGQTVKPPTAAAETPLARRERVEQMTPQEKDQLNRKAGRFFELPLDEQRQLRALHEAIQQHPQRDELYRVMFSYYDWLKTLTAGEPTDLHQLGPEERLAKIKQIEGKRLTNEDRQAVETWARELVQDRPVELRFGPPREPRPPGGPGDERSPRFLLLELGEQLRQQKIPPLTKPEIDKVGQKLSEPRKNYLASLSLPEQRAQVQDWMRSVTWRPFSRQTFSEEQVRILLKKLPDELREKVIKRPPHEMHRYFRERDYGGDRLGPPPGMGREGPRGRGEPGFSPGFGGPGPPSPDRDGRGRPDRDGDLGPGE